MQEFFSSEIGFFVLEMLFLLSAVGFFVGLKLLSSPKSARNGNLLGAFSMGIAVFLTLWVEAPSNLLAIFICLGFGSILGLVAAKKVQMTAMPQMVAIFNGLGGIASVFVAFSESLRFFHDQEELASSLFSISSWFSVVVGAVTFSGSIIAFLKLQGLMPSRPILVVGQRFVSGALFLASLAAVYLLIKSPEDILIFSLVALVAAILGILLVIPIGGADMPVVISLLNSYSGLAATAAGFVVQSNLLIIAGALVGASGLILTRLMCQAMNRSLANVVFGAFGAVDQTASTGDEKPMKEFLPLDAAMLLKNSNKVIIVPGYGLAVSQAQRNLRELSDALKDLGVEIIYGIHPVAGRMPGHMNVLLAEADVPYDELFDQDRVNGEFETADVALIIGANDVVNPSALTDEKSPLYGMPILQAQKAKTVVVMKRGRGRGFAGVENPLFTLDNAGVVFGDAKDSLVKVQAALKSV